jgi:uncharacterized protein YdhG (YjbR/CyaY superfamily)
MAQKQYASFEEYLKDQTPACQEALRQLREIILQVVPDTEELFNYNIPAFTLLPGGKENNKS